MAVDSGGVKREKMGIDDIGGRRLSIQHFCEKERRGGDMGEKVKLWLTSIVEQPHLLLRQLEF